MVAYISYIAHIVHVRLFTHIYEHPSPHTCILSVCLQEKTFYSFAVQIHHRSFFHGRHGDNYKLGKKRNGKGAYKINTMEHVSSSSEEEEERYELGLKHGKWDEMRRSQRRS